MSVRPWRLLLDPPASAAWNMSLDEALLECALEQPPTLRFYTWSEPSVSLGYRQAAPAWLERCERLSVPVVRRVSGGGAVLHAGDLTYAVITPLSVRELPGDLRGSYEWIRNVLVDGLRAAGLDVQPSRAETGAERLALCFAGATGLEIELERVKLVGSAQRRTRWGFLQHGSIRLADDSALYEALPGQSPAWSPDLEKLEPGAVQEALCQAFARALGGHLEEGTLADLDLTVATERHAARLRDRLAVPPLSLRRIPGSADTLA